MANEIDGRDIYLIIDNDIFANEQGLANNETQATMETTNKHTTNSRKTFIYGDGTGTITANGFYCVTDPSGQTGYHDLKAKMKAKTKIVYELGKFGIGGIIETGTALITAINMKADLNSPATFDISLLKDGDYTEVNYDS
jgi:predicted secreted protein